MSIEHSTGALYIHAGGTITPVQFVLLFITLSLLYLRSLIFFIGSTQFLSTHREIRVTIHLPIIFPKEELLFIREKKSLVVITESEGSRCTSWW